MGALDRGETVPDSSDVGRESRELFQMECGKGFEALCALVGQVQVDDPVVGLAAVAPHESRGLGPVDEFYSAVVAQHEVVRHFTDRGADLVGMAPDREQELVVGWSEPCRARLLRRPALEVSKAGTKGEKASVRVVG